MDAYPQQTFSSPPQGPCLATAPTMRVAIAGSGGLACWIAHYLATETYHPFIILSRAVMCYSSDSRKMSLLIDISRNRF